MGFTMEVKPDCIIVYRKVNKQKQEIARFFTESAMSMALLFLGAVNKSEFMV
jgi:hypothetical protein